MTTEVKNKLDKIIGDTFLYNNKKISIVSYKELTTGLIVIKTNSRTFSFLPPEIDKFLNDIQEIKDTGLTTKPTAPTLPKAFTYQKSETHIKIETSLVDMIDKVVADPKIIPQASALCNIANTLVNLEKQQINMLKATNQL